MVALKTPEMTELRLERDYSKSAGLKFGEAIKKLDAYQNRGGKGAGYFIKGVLFREIRPAAMDAFLGAVAEDSVFVEEAVVNGVEMAATQARTVLALLRTLTPELANEEMVAIAFDQILIDWFANDSNVDHQDDIRWIDGWMAGITTERREQFATPFAIAATASAIMAFRNRKSKHAESQRPRLADSREALRPIADDGAIEPELRARALLAMVQSSRLLGDHQAADKYEDILRSLDDEPTIAVLERDG